MKTLGLFASVVLAGFSSLSEAATYQVSGWHANPFSDPKPFPYGESYTPSAPGFDGSWNIDITIPSVTGVLDFAPYTVTVDVENIGTLGAVRPNDIGTLGSSSATFTYDAASRTLTVAGANLTINGVQSCVSTGYLFCSLGDQNISSDEVSEFQQLRQFDFSLIFDATFDSFTGLGRSTLTSEGSTFTEEFSFTGTAVPVPAAVWFFGTALGGLGVVRRYRKNP